MTADIPPSAASSAAPWCSLITVTHNSARVLEHFWAVYAEFEAIEWIVVDNASTDDTVYVARALGARVIRLENNSGFSYANNVGYQAASADFIGFLNPDVRPDIEALQTLAEAARAHRAIVGPQLLNADGSLQPNGRGFPTLAAKIRNRLQGDDRRYQLFGEGDEALPVVWLMGAAVLGHRREIDRIGGWDPRFFLYYEDSDLGMRSWSADVPVLLIPTAHLLHGWARETAGGFRLLPWRREIASMTKFYARYPSLLLSLSAVERRHSAITGAVFPPLATEDAR